MVVSIGENQLVQLSETEGYRPAVEIDLRRLGIDAPDDAEIATHWLA